MSDLIKEINSEKSFDNTISQGVTLVDFWAPWCGPCKMQTPVLEKVAVDVQDKAKIAKVNVDETSSVAQDFGIQAIPTLVLFKDGNEIKRFIGLQTKEVLLHEIKSL